MEWLFYSLENSHESNRGGVAYNKLQALQFY